MRQTVRSWQTRSVTAWVSYPEGQWETTLTAGSQTRASREKRGQIDHTSLLEIVHQREITEEILERERGRDSRRAKERTREREGKRGVEPMSRRDGTQEGDGSHGKSQGEGQSKGLAKTQKGSCKGTRSGKEETSFEEAWCRDRGEEGMDFGRYSPKPRDGRRRAEPRGSPYGRGRNVQRSACPDTRKDCPSGEDSGRSRDWVGASGVSVRGDPAMALQSSHPALQGALLREGLRSDRYERGLGTRHKDEEGAGYISRCGLGHLSRSGGSPRGRRDGRVESSRRRFDSWGYGSEGGQETEAIELKPLQKSEKKEEEGQEGQETTQRQKPRGDRRKENRRRRPWWI